MPLSLCTMYMSESDSVRPSVSLSLAQIARKPKPSDVYRIATDPVLLEALDMPSKLMGARCVGG